VNRPPGGTAEAERAQERPRMSNPNNPGHGKPRRDSGDVDTRDLEARNEARGLALRTEEPRSVHEAGGDTKGESLGGAHTGRYGASPGNVASNRERKPRGDDKA